MRLASAALLAVALAALVGGCSRGVRAGGATDGPVSYRADEPAFVLEAVAAVREGETGVDVVLGVPRSSLSFRPVGAALEAVARWTVTLERGGVPVSVRAVADTVRAASAADGPAGGAARQPGPVWRRVRFDAPAGRYRVRAVLEDPVSEETAARDAEVAVVAPDARPALGALRVEAVDGGGEAAPVDPASVPAATDSLLAVVQATSAPDGATAVLTVVRLLADASPAAPPAGAGPAPDALARRGVGPSVAGTVGVTRRALAAPGLVADVEVPLPALAPGVYALRLSLEASDGTSLDVARRVVTVRRPDYPALTHLADLVEPLVYLAGRDEVERISGADTPSARRRAFDRFWGERMDDRRLAAATVRAFYERVEEANRLFASYKDGWKTDPGMIYILFGPPRYVEATANGERWAYGSGNAAPAAVTFERTASGAGPFAVLTLARDRGYADVWERARDQWRSGVVP